MTRFYLGKIVSVFLVMSVSFFYSSCQNDDDSDDKSEKTETNLLGLKRKPDSLGDVVFKDGSATGINKIYGFSDEQKNSAIAVIYKVEGKKAYGVGFRHNKNGLKWCTENASASNVLVSAIQCIPSCDPGADGFRGDKNALIYSGKIDGKDNLEVMGNFLYLHSMGNDTSDPEKYPAFYFAKNYKEYFPVLKGTEFEDGWYLPTIDELFSMWKAGPDIYDQIASYVGGDLFGTDVYWSSSQANVIEVSYKFTFGFGFWIRSGKNYAEHVCCVRVFE